MNTIASALLRLLQLALSPETLRSQARAAVRVKTVSQLRHTIISQHTYVLIVLTYNVCLTSDIINS